jgi:hypothetical protein
VLTLPKGAVSASLARVVVAELISEKSKVGKFDAAGVYSVMEIVVTSALLASVNEAPTQLTQYIP